MSRPTKSSRRSVKRHSKVAAIALDLERWRKDQRTRWPSPTTLFVTDRDLFFRLAKASLTPTEKRTHQLLAAAADLTKRTWQIRQAGAKRRGAPAGRGKNTGNEVVSGRKISRRSAEVEIPEISENYTRLVSRLRLGSASTAVLRGDLNLSRPTLDRLLGVLKSRRLVAVTGKNVSLRAHR